MKLFLFLQVTLISSYCTNIFLVSAAEDATAPVEVERQLNIENDNILRDYLGYYGKFIPEQMENWCPTNCNNGSQIFVDPHFSAYCSCIDKEGSWRTEKHYCAENEIFNETASVCHEIPGKGYPTCIMNGHKCPNNHTGIRKHPDKNLFRNYIICSRDMVIVGECTEMHHFDYLKESCARLTITNTDLVVSDCPTVQKIECKKPGIFPVNSKETGSKVCKNCFYICGIKNEKTFELKISCETEPVGQIENVFQINYTSASETLGNEWNQVIENIQIEYPSENSTENFDHTETLEENPHQTESTTMLELDEIRISETIADYSVDEAEPPKSSQSNEMTHSCGTPTRHTKDKSKITERSQFREMFIIGETPTKHPVNDTKVFESSQSGKLPPNGGALTNHPVNDTEVFVISSSREKTDDETPSNDLEDDTKASGNRESGETTPDGELPIGYQIDDIEVVSEEITTYHGETLTEYQEVDSGISESGHPGETAFSTESLTKHSTDNTEVPESSQSGKTTLKDETPTKDNETLEIGQSGKTAPNCKCGAPTKQLKLHFWVICWWTIINLSRW